MIIIIMIKPLCIMFNGLLYSGFAKTNFWCQCWLMTKCCEVFLGVSIRDVRDSNEMTGPGSVQLYSDMCTVQLPVYSVQPGNFHPHLSGQSGAGERAGRRAEPCSVRGPATRLSETNHLQFIYPQLIWQMQVNKDLKFWNNEETVKAEVWKDYLKQITRYSHSYANTHSLTW